jgi:hypothetical protein
VELLTDLTIVDEPAVNIDKGSRQRNWTPLFIAGRLPVQ